LHKAIGFSVLLGGDAGASERFLQTHDRVLKRFPWLHVDRAPTDWGPARVVVWGFGDVGRCVRRRADSRTLLIVNGARDGQWRWPEVERYFDGGPPADCGLPWEGIGNVVQVGSDAVRVLNDWTGATKVYAGCTGSLVCVSTLEPVAHDTLQPTRADIDATAVYALLKTGHYIGDQTLYRTIRVQLPDSDARYSTAGAVVRRRWTVRPSEELWSRGWDDLVDEWGAVLEAAIAEGLGAPRAVTLMLSGGLDSRVIAAIAMRRGFEVHPVCYGNRTWQDTQHAQTVSRALGLRLRVVPIGREYLRDFTRPWCEWFGASMCVHGMYQYPALLDHQAHAADREIVTGFTGDPLEGMQTAAMMAGPPDTPLLERVLRKVAYWDDSGIAQLVPWLPVADAREDLEQRLRDQYDSFSGSPFQRVWLLFQWNHVSQFSSYQPTMCDYFAGAVTPFVHRRLANFCLSLPRVALERRRLFLDVIRSRFPVLARAPGTYDLPGQIFDFLPARYGIPLILTKRYLAKAAVGYVLPTWLRVGPFREFGPTPNQFAQKAIARYGLKSLYPFDVLEPDDQDFFDPQYLRRFVGRVLDERRDIYPQMKLWPVQALLSRLMVRA